MRIRPWAAGDEEAIWAILKPIFRAGETYAIEPDIGRAAALDYWTAGHCFVAEENGQVLGSYYIRPNQRGGGSHVCNCGFATAPGAQGRGVARAMLAHAQQEARRRGFEAMQFNFVLESNSRAIETWLRAGFKQIGRIPWAFHHPKLGMVDALILHKFLEQET